MLEELQEIDNSVYERLTFAERSGKTAEALTVALCDNEKAFHDLQEEWNDLLDHAARKSAFLRHEFMYLWWEIYGRRQRGATPFILTARDGERRLVGVLPLYREKSRLPLVGIRELRFLGSMHEAPEYLDIIVAGDAPKHKIIKTMLAGLHNLRAKSYDLLRLTDMSEEALLLEYLPEWTASCGGRLQLWPWMVCPHIKIAGDFETYLQTLSPKHRANFRRQLQKLKESHTVSMEIADDPAQVEAAFETLFELHHQRWAKKNIQSAFDNETSHLFHHRLAKALAENDAVRVFSLKCDGQTVAALYCFFYDDRLMYYQAGFDVAFESKSVGLILLGMILQHCFEQGYREFDFLRGLEDYKFRWTKLTRKTLACEIALSWRGKTYLNSLHGLRHLKKIIQNFQKNLRFGTTQKTGESGTT